MTRALLQLSLALVAFAFSSYIFLFSNHLIEPFELKIKDQMWQVRGALPVDENIVIVDIDEQSLQELGQWPWPRKQVADLLYKLAELEVGMIGMDVVFAEPDNASPHKLGEEFGLKELNLPNYDSILAQAVADTPTILGYVFIQQPDKVQPDLVPSSNAIIIERNKPEKSYLFKPYRAQLNLPLVQNSAYSSGFFNTVPDADGVVRSVPLLMEFADQLFPALGLEMVRIIVGEPRVTLDYFEKGVEFVHLGDLQIPTDAFGRLRINYRGGAFQYPYISAGDILAGRVDPEAIAGKIVLVGTSAAGLLDLRATPFSSVYPGVEVHANLIDNLLNQNFVSQPIWTLGADLLILVISAIIVSLVLIYFSSLVGFLITFVLLSLLVIINYSLMIDYGLVLNIFIPLLLIVTLFLLGTVVNYFFETRQKNFIKTRFSQKVSPAVVNELINTRADLVLEGTEKEITIFFSDIRGFTALSEAMGSAKELIRLLNRYMDPMVEIITQTQGTVDKFIGDAIMAYWNAPLDVENHADQALLSAVKQILELTKLNQELAKESLPLIKIGIGINTGLAVVGEMGSIGRSDYTCIGDPVNLASRAEGLTKAYRAKIIITENTLRALNNPEKFKIRYLDQVKVKGKDEPVKIYECYGMTAGLTEELSQNQIWLELTNEHLELYQTAQTFYMQGNFKQALELFKQLNQQQEQYLYQLFIDRCSYYLQNPPVYFNGVFTMQTK